MQAHPADGRFATWSWAGEAWGGLAAMLVALPSSIAYGVLAYSALGPEHAGQGALAGVLGAAALGIVAPLVGRTRGLISAPSAPAAAVLSALVAGYASGQSGTPLGAAQITALLGLVALLAAGLQALYGAVGGGRLIKYVPFPVVSGYLSGVAALIALGQLPRLLGLPKGTGLLTGLVSPDLWRWQGLVVGVVTMVAMVGAPRLTRRVPPAILGLLAGVLAYLGLGAVSPEGLRLIGNPLIIGPLQASGSLSQAVADRFAALAACDLRTAGLVLVPALTLSVLLSIDTLKTCVILDTLTRTRHRANRELVGQGLGNLAAFAAGGMPGSGTMGPTLVNVNSGGRTVRAGVIEGACVVLALLALGRVIAWVPIGALAGILLVIAWRMFDRSALRLLRTPLGRIDFAVICAVALVAVAVDLIAAAGVGVGLAILLFIRDQTRSSVIRHRRHLGQVSSKTRRRAAERRLLAERGAEGVLCELQGNLFFGTTDQLLTQLEPDLRSARYLILDMRRVQSVDYTAAHLLEQLQAQLSERAGGVLLCGLPSSLPDHQNLREYLTQLGLVEAGKGIRVSETLDGALEWIEERILESAGAARHADGHALSLPHIDLFRGLTAEDLHGLTAWLREVTVAAGERIFSTGEPGGEIYLVRRGSVRILLPLEGGQRHHVATIGRGDFFGEISFLDRGRRSADAEAKEPTDLYALSRTHFDCAAGAHAALAARVFARLALAIAERLRQADTELRTLEGR
ncbi:MAG: SulP family inorganic anion transporter [Candidatus Latescibacterota bacterium]